MNTRASILAALVLSVSLPIRVPAARAQEMPRPDGSSERHRAATVFDGPKCFERLSAKERADYPALEYLLNDHQSKQYLMLSTPAEREKWVNRFWLEIDPTPSTERNERRVEHDERVRQARKRYPAKDLPGWDRRGEALIRFGEPDSIIKVAADLDFWNERMPGEVWYYYRHDMMVAFEDVSLQGEYTWFMDIEGVNGRQAEEIRRGSTGKASSEGSVMPFIPPIGAAALGDLDAASGNPYSTGYIASMNAASLFGPSISTDVGLEAGMEKIARQTNNFFTAVDRRRYIHGTDEEENLGLYFDFTSFGAGGGKLRTEVNFEIPADELKFREKRGKFESKFSLAVDVRDMEFGEVVTAKDDVELSVDEDPSLNPGKLYPAQFILTLDPGYYRIALEIFDKRTGRRGVYRTSKNIESMGGTLGLSDIQFASYIAPAGGGSNFIKGTLRVVPHPLHTYKKPAPLRFYFEVYGLGADSGDLSFYEVEYSIIPKGMQRKGPVFVATSPVVSSGFKTSGYGPVHPQRLEIETGDLREGAFVLRVVVRDRISGLSAERLASFSIVD